MSVMITSIKRYFQTVNAILKVNTAYNIVLCCKLSGKIDIPKLHKCWLDCSALIPELYGVCDVEKIQIVSEEKAYSFVKKESENNFDLSDSGVPLRAFILELNTSDCLFCVIQHHSLIDLHSKNLLSRTISELYNKGKSSFKFLKYKETEPAILNMEFWKNQLENEPSPLLLPSALPERGNFTGDGHTIFADMPDWVGAGLQNIEIEYQLQDFLIFLTVYAVMLLRLSGQDDFFIGIPFSNRKNPEREFMYGPFVNVLPLRVQIDNSDTFITLYSKIRKQMLLLNRNQDAPFLEISRLYLGQRDSRIPFFIQAGFTREDPFNLDLDGLKCSTVDIRPDGAQMDLFLTYWQENDRFRYRWEYNTNAFTESQALGWKKSYENILKQVLTLPDIKISDISMLQDRSGVSVFKETIRKYPVEIPLRALLEKVRKQNSDITAIRDKTRSLNYNQFDKLVNQYSSVLYAKAGSGKYIAVSIDNSIERTILIHSIVNSGNVYIPVDPNWPSSRVDYILGNSGASLAVIEKRNSGKYQSDVETVFIDYFQVSDISTDIRMDKKPHDPFAVLYTSGSTGNPKGVFINGDGLINRLYWMQEAYPLKPGDSLLHKVPFTFDVSMWEIFWPFLFGASLYIPEPAKHLDDNYLANTIREQKIKYVHFVPSLLKKFLDYAKNTDLPELKAVICSGEALEVSLLEQYFAKIGNKPLHNLYGPTEASIDVTAWTCSKGDLDKKRIPIGYPIANTRIYILDKYGKLCLPYVKGDIVIAGINVSDGYVNNPELTSKVFIEGDWGFGRERVYFTGDLGFYSEQGIIYYDGRKDSQVKINGIRIELSEIERQLEKLRSVKAAAVIIPGKNQGDMTIFAYLKTESNIDITSIKKDLSHVLPGYMIPGTFVVLEDFPMLTSGKIDRKALTAITPDVKTDSASKPVKAAGHSGEISSLWSELLNLAEIPLDISFFDIGGHSQLLPELKSRLEKLSGVEIELIDLFNYPTVQSQCELLFNSGSEVKIEVSGNERRQIMRRAAQRGRQRRNG